MAATLTGKAYVCAVVALGMSFGGCAYVDKIKVGAGMRPKDAAQRTAYSIRELPTPASPLPIDAVAGNKHVRTALSAKGMDETSAPDKVVVEVADAYKLRETRLIWTFSKPVYGSIPGDSYTETELGLDANGNMTSRIVTRKFPDIPFIDPTRERQVTQVIYEKSLHIVAVEKKSTTPGVPLRVWDISISYEDRDPKMDKAMPLLAAAGCARIGTKTDGPITVRLRDKDEVVAFINRGL
jgi:hypothetical protein